MSRLIMPHCPHYVHGVKVSRHITVKTERVEDFVVTHHDPGVDPAERVRETRGVPEANRHGFPVTKFIGISGQGERLNGVSQGMAVVQ